MHPGSIPGRASRSVCGIARIVANATDSAPRTCYPAIVTALTRLFAIMALFLSLMTGSVAHGAGTIGCVAVTDVATEMASGHVDRAPDSTSTDTDRVCPHHHGGCHGHHIAAPSEGAAALPRPASADRRIAARSWPVRDVTIDPTRRPPRA